MVGLTELYYLNSLKWCSYKLCRTISSNDYTSEGQRLPTKSELMLGSVGILASSFYFRKLRLYFVLIFRSDLLLFSFDMRYTTCFPPYCWNYLFLQTTKILVITLKGNHVILLDSEILWQFYNFHLSGLIAVNQDGLIACHLKKCWTSDQWQTWRKTPYDNCVCFQVLFQCKSLWR